MKIGMVVTEPCKTSEELDALEVSMRSETLAVEFIEADDSEEA